MEISYKEKHFTNEDLEEFAPYEKLRFTKCSFEGSIAFDAKVNLKFSNCTFEGIWEHIICEKVVYSQCNFDTFNYHNPNQTNEISKDTTLFDSTFKQIECQGITFEKPFLHIVDERKVTHLNRLSLIHCEFKSEFNLSLNHKSDAKLIEIHLDTIDLSHSVFYKNFKMQFCNIAHNANFHNTRFRKLADFYKTSFSNVDFSKTDFEDIAVFSEVTFHEDIDFKYTKFLGYSIFRDTVIKKKLNLRNTIFDASANATFLDISSVQREAISEESDELIGETTPIAVANRETARIIKDFYEKSNNIIEANKFYALEMQQMAQELSPTKNPFQWLVFWMHSVSSNHSQSWILALMWIFIFALSAVIYTSQHAISTIQVGIAALFISVLSLILYYTLYKHMKYIFTVLLSLVLLAYTLTINPNALTEVASHINPFSIMLPDTGITIKLLIYKATMAYLIYQFVVSIRQNTRRK